MLTHDLRDPELRLAPVSEEIVTKHEKTFDSYI
jgi:hypothetical protein